MVGVAGTPYRLAGALRLLGRLREADAVCRNALTYIDAEGLSRVSAAGILHVAISEVLVEQNELESAEIHLAQGLQLGKWSGRIKAVIYASFALPRIKQARRDTDGALAAVQEALAALGKTPSPLLKAELLSQKAKIFLRQGVLNEAVACMEEAVQPAGRDQGQTGEVVSLVVTRVQVANTDIIQIEDQNRQGPKQFRDQIRFISRFFVGEASNSIIVLLGMGYQLPTVAAPNLLHHQIINGCS